MPPDEVPNEDELEDNHDEVTLEDHTGPDDGNSQTTRQDRADNKGEKTDDDDEIEYAELLEMAKNPRTRRAALLAMAEKQGIGAQSQTRDRDETSGRFTQQNRQEPQKTAKTPLVERLKAKMGADYDLLPSSMWDALKEVIADEIEPHNQRFDEFAKGIGKREAEAGMDRFFDKHKPALKHEAKLAALSNRYAPRDGQTVESYMKDLWYQYCGDRGWNPQTGTSFGTTNKDERQNRNDRNLREAPQQRTSGGPQERGRTNQPQDRRAIIAAAIAQHTKSRT